MNENDIFVAPSDILAMIFFISLQKVYQVTRGSKRIDKNRTTGNSGAFGFLSQ